MQQENKHNIHEFTESEFVSFLFSERERENSLSEFHGWNNWALVGAIVSVLCAGYAILKDKFFLDTTEVIYHSCCILAFFLTYHSWTLIFRRERGVDFSRVRMLKEVIPVVKIVFVICSAITASILIPIYDDFNIVFWLWIAIIAAYIITICVAYYLRDKIVPSYFMEMNLPWIWVNVGYEAILGCLFSVIGTQSFKKAGSNILTSEFEFAACITAIHILLYILFKLNFSNKVVRRFDAILDKYFYAGATMEETFHEIFMNRMGYGVLDGCIKELRIVEKHTELCIEEGKELDEMKDTVLSGKCSVTQIKEYQGRIDIILVNQQAALNMSRTLVRRMDEIVEVSSSYRLISEINQIFDTNNQCYKKVESVLMKAREVSRLLHETEMGILTKVITALEEVKKKETEKE